MCLVKSGNQGSQIRNQIKEAETHWRRRAMLRRNPNRISAHNQTSGKVSQILE